MNVPNLEILNTQRQSSQYVRDKRAVGKPIITAEQVRDRFKCDLETGKLTYRFSTGGVRKDAVAGTLTPQGYNQVFIDYWSFRSSRVIYLYVTGEWPPVGYYMDHIDGNRSNDRWENLRLATPTENARNRQTCRRNTTGVLGVHPIIGTAKFGAEIGYEGKNVKLGRFECIADAAAARCEAERHYFGVWARGAK